VSNPNTSVQNASLNAQVSPAGTKADNINLNVPSIGVITGAGEVSPSGALAFKMVADLHGGMAGGASKVAAFGSGKSGVPFAIEGTTSNPKFIPDIGGVVGGLAKNELGKVTKAQVPGTKNMTKTLGGAFGKKK
jgi:AsmA protein